MVEALKVHLIDKAKTIFHMEKIKGKIKFSMQTQVALITIGTLVYNLEVHTTLHALC